MATLYVRDLSDEAVEELKVRAARNRQSLQAYAREILESEAAIPVLDDVVAKIREQATARLSTTDVVDNIDADRRRA